MYQVGNTSGFTVMYVQVCSESRREVIYPFVYIPRLKQLHTSYYTILAYGYFSLRNWDKHHCTEDEQANPLLIYAY